MLINEVLDRSVKASIIKRVLVKVESQTINPAKGLILVSEQYGIYRKSILSVSL